MLAAQVGIEPTNDGFRDRCLTTWLLGIVYVKTWPGWDRTNECRFQRAVPYHLATGQRVDHVMLINSSLQVKTFAAG